MWTYRRQKQSIIMLWKLPEIGASLARLTNPNWVPVRYVLGFGERPPWHVLTHRFFSAHNDTARRTYGPMDTDQLHFCESARKLKTLKTYLGLSICCNIHFTAILQSRILIFLIIDSSGGGFPQTNQTNPLFVSRSPTRVAGPFSAFSICEPTRSQAIETNKCC